MCRVLAYVGAPVPLESMLYGPDSSLVKQAIAPRMLHISNLGGFGMAAWDPSSRAPREPHLYRSTAVPVFDANLQSLSQKISVEGLLAHVRGVPYHSGATLGEHNLHPFRYDGFRWALAHNGDLYRFTEMKYALLEHIRPEIAARIRGTTDSEWMYAVLMSQLDDPTAEHGPVEIARAVDRTLRIVRGIRDAAGIDVSSPANLFLCDGRRLVAARFTFDYGCYPLGRPEAIEEMQLRYLSLWYTLGSRYGFHDGEWKMVGGADAADSMLVASEPLTRDASTWIELPEYSLVYAERSDGRLVVSTFELDA
jgi:predicted glutamine amidotransferase